VTVQLLSDPELVAQVWPPGEEVTVYLVTVEPLLGAADQLTFACPTSAVAETPLGGPGAPEMVVELDVPANPVPWEFVAVTLKA
jgi:hypothetical protein